MNVQRAVLLLLLGVLPLAFWPGSTSFSAIKVSLLLICCGVLLAHLGLGLLRGRQMVALVRGDRSWLVVAVLWLWLGGSAWLSSPYTGTLGRSLLLGLVWLLVAWFMVHALNSSARRRKALAVLLASAGLAALLGLAQLAGVVPGAPAQSGYPPAISTLGNQNYLAGFCAVLFLPALSLVVEGRAGRRFRSCLPGLIPVLLLGAVVVLTGARGPQLAVALAGVVLAGAAAVGRVRGSIAWYSARSLKSLMVLGGMGVLFTLFLFVPGANNAVGGWREQVLQTRLVAGNNGAVRLADWIIARDMTAHWPWTGVGAGGYAAGWIATRHRLAAEPADGWFPDQLPASAWAHGDLLQWTAETGLVGLALLLVLAVLLARRWFRRLAALPLPQERWGFLLLSGGLLSALFLSLVSFPCHRPATLLAVVCVGTVLGGARSDEGASSTSPRPVPRPRRRWAGLPVALAGMLCLVWGGAEVVADAALARGLTHLHRRDYPAAEAALDLAVRWGWQQPEPRYYRGMARLGLGRTGPAEADLEQSLALIPSFPALLARAEILVESGRRDQAVELLAQVAGCRTYNQHQLQVRYLQARACLLEGRTSEAARLFRELLAELDGQIEELGPDARDRAMSRLLARRQAVRRNLLILPEKLDGTGRDD